VHVHYIILYRVLTNTTSHSAPVDIKGIKCNSYIMMYAASFIWHRTNKVFSTEISMICQAKQTDTSVGFVVLQNILLQLTIYMHRIANW